MTRPFRYSRGSIWILKGDKTPFIAGVQGASRPILLMSNDIHNRHSPSVNGFTISTTIRDKVRLPVHVRINIDGVSCDVQLEQPKTVNKGQLAKYLGKLDEDSMKRVEEALLLQFAIKS